MHRPTVRTAVVALGAAAMFNAVAMPAHAVADNTSPISTGCSSSAITARSTGLNNSGGNFGIIELRYSTSCRSVWARVTSTYGIACVPGDDGCGGAQVHRNQTNTDLWCSTPGGTKTCFTNQLNDAGYTSYAHGWVDTGALTAYGTTSSY